MTGNDEISIKIQGLEEDRGFVRADVFAEKLKGFVDTLKAADRSVNEKPTHEYVIRKLEAASAFALLREKPITKSVIQRNPVAEVIRIAEYIEAKGAGDALSSEALSLPKKPVECLADIAGGALKTHKSVEIGVEDAESVFCLDDAFEKKARNVVSLLECVDRDTEVFYRGESFATFDGAVKLVDTRNGKYAGKIVLALNDLEIPCTFNPDDFDAIKSCINDRVLISGWATYDGKSGLPCRVRVDGVRPVKKNGNLIQWRGLLDEPYPTVTWDDYG